MHIDPIIAALVVAVVVLVVGHARGARALAASAKLSASALFLVLGVARGLFESDAGRVLFVGLVLSFVGDAALLSKEKKPFLVGLGAFLLAHVAYAAAFAQSGLDDGVLPFSGTALLVVGAVVLRWLWPHVKGSMRGPVVLYVLAISAMVALAAARLGPSSAIVLNGAILFMVSDVFVARERFVQSGPMNRILGLPLYYAGQVLLIVGHGA